MTVDASADEQVVREFISTFNRSELDSFVATLDPDVEIHSMRGIRRGPEEARDWATRTPGGVQQTVAVKSVEQRDDSVLVEIERHWHWEEDSSHAATDEMAWLFTVRTGRIASWRPFEDRDDARRNFETG